MFDEEESDDEGHRPLFFLFSRCCQPQPGELDQPGKMWNDETPKVASWSLVTPGYALTVAHKRKIDKSWGPCNQQGIVFLPLAVESLGAWHKPAILEVKKLGSLLARHTGEDESTTTKHLFQQLSIALVKGNAALMAIGWWDVLKEQVPVTYHFQVYFLW